MVTKVAQDPYSVTIYKLGDTYYGARSNEFGYANYEIIPYPQFVQNPVTAMLNQFSIELGLNEQQRQQILPFLQDEVKQLGALKKNTSLKPLDKLEQLKKIADEIDAKVTPLLDQQQQQKFQAIREEHRRELIEKMAEPGDAEGGEQHNEGRCRDRPELAARCPLDLEKAMKNKVLALSAAAEAGTGLLLLAYPPIVVRLLFAAEITGAGIVMSRLAGIALIGLGVACWPGNPAVQQLYGMLTYSTLAMLYLIRIGVRGEAVGLLLWPGVVVHAILIVLLGGAWLKQRKTPST